MTPAFIQPGRGPAARLFFKNLSYHVAISDIKDAKPDDYAKRL